MKRLERGVNGPRRHPTSHSRAACAVERADESRAHDVATDTCEPRHRTLDSGVVHELLQALAVLASRRQLRAVPKYDAILAVKHRLQLRDAGQIDHR